MKFTLDTSRYAGKITSKATFITNDAQHPSGTLWCKGTVLVPFKTVPNYVNFGQINRSSEVQRRTVQIKRGDGGPLAPKLLPFDNPNLHASLREMEPGERYELDVEIRPPWPNRPLSAELKLTTGVSEAPEESIRVTARIAPRLRAHPATFRIPRNLRDEIEKKARMVWSGDPPGKIVEATASDAQLSVRVEEDNGQQSVVLHVPPGYDPPVNSRARVTVKTDDPAVPTLPIHVYVPPPRPRLRAMPGWFGIPSEITTAVDLQTRLEWSGNPGKILEATASDPATSVRIEQRNNRQYLILHVPAGYTLPAPGGAVITITTDDPKFPTLQIPVRAGGPQHAMRPGGAISPGLTPRVIGTTGPGSPRTSTQPKP